MAFGLSQCVVYFYAQIKEVNNACFIQWAPVIEVFCTIALVIIAATAAYFAWRDIRTSREQSRRNTFLALLNELALPRSRDNRAKIHEEIKPMSGKKYNEYDVRIWIVHGRAGEKKAERIKEAIEETISCLDRLGFFLLRGDSKMKDEAPEWIWTIAKEMWGPLGAYVKYQQKRHRGWGRYFEELASQADNFLKKPHKK